jgi:hypothetical protein
MSWIRRVAAFALIFGGAQAFGCGTDAVGTDSCRKIEQARCGRAPDCPALMLQSGGVEECMQFARDRCLHGLAVPDPGAAVVDACTAAVQRGTCDVVSSPQIAPECAFLQPAPVSDAGADGADAADASDDTSDGSATSDAQTD